MTTVANPQLQTDHRFWLRDIERWQYDIEIWSNARQKLLDDAEMYMQTVRQFVDDIDSHASSVREHQKAIAACERDMIAHANTDAEQQHLAEMHAMSAEAHREQLEQHRRMEQLRHTLMTQLGMLNS